MTLTKPAKLNKGDTIGLCAPAYYTPHDEIRQCAQVLEGLGYNVYIHQQCYVRDAWLAGTVEERVQAIHDLFENPDIKAIMFTKGGYGCIQLLDHIDYDLLCANPKIVMGYSDNTALIQAIHKKCGLVTFHGPNAYRFIGDSDHEQVIDSFQRVISGEPPVYQFTGKDHNDPIVVNPGRVEACLNGGNHMLLSHLIGTDYLNRFVDSLFFTESNHPMYTDVDMVLHQFRLSGLIENIQGFILGKMEGHHYRDPDLSHIFLNMNFENIAGSHFPDIPVVTNFPCGHEGGLLTFPLGIPFELVAEEDGSVILTQKEPAVI